jgi:GNAT superfamily N-acetyltransferase
VRTFDIRPVRYSHPDAQRLVAEVQQEYVIRYGGPDETPVDDEEFSPPRGRFFLLRPAAGTPAAMGGWRMVDIPGSSAPGPDPAPAAVAELKRMYVVPAYRGRGFARAMLAHLEATAGAAGACWLVLETGTRQPEAIELYRAAGYIPVPPFGHYADQPGSVHLGKPLAGVLPGLPRPGSSAG